MAASTQTNKERQPFQINARRRHGRCYELAWKGVMAADDVQLVHGELRYNNLSIGHAWLIGNDFVYDPVLDEFFDPGEYHLGATAVALHMYTQLEAASLACQEGHYGPWDNSGYSDHCLWRAEAV